MLEDCAKAFADPHEALPFDTAVVANIRTTDEQFVHSELYPYPRNVDDFFAAKLNDLLKNDSIQKSMSPYNNSLGGRQKRC